MIMKIILVIAGATALASYLIDTREKKNRKKELEELDKRYEEYFETGEWK